MTTIYHVNHLCKNFTLNRDTITVLKDLSFKIQEGTWTAIVGPSGSGKTTLLQLLGGLDHPTSGEIILKDQNIAKMNGRKLTAMRHRTIGFVFQSYHLFPELTALENVVLPALQWGTNRQEVYRRAEEWLGLFGLQSRSRHLPQELSGGEQQRVAIARALINDPKIILADEPTGNLDTRATQQIVDILNLIRKKHGKTIIMVTHDLNLADKTDGIIPLIKHGNDAGDEAQTH